MAGWFAVERDLVNSDLWLAEPFTRGQAIVDLHGLARHSAGHVRLKGVRIDLQPGELAWSEQSLADRWRWSRGKVRRFLAELASEHVLVQRTSNVTSVITMLSEQLRPASDTANSSTSGTADGTASSTANGTQKNKETIKQPPPPAPSEPTESDRSAWKAVEEELAARGVSAAATTVREAAEAGFTPADVYRRIAEFDAKPGAWGAGALRRVASGKLSVWPPTDPHFENRQASVSSRRAATENRAEYEQRRAVNAARSEVAANLDAIHGPALDSIDQPSLRRLYDETFGGNAETEWNSYLRRGRSISKPQRAELLNHLAIWKAAV